MQPEYLPQALELLDDWVHDLASMLPAPIQVPVRGYDFRWKYPRDTPEVLLVLKSVRLTTSLAGAWYLAHQGLTTESGSLCRQVGDFASEIWFVTESILKGETNAAHRKFVEDFFQPTASSVEEHLARERDRYVSRADISKAEQRLASEAGLDGERVRDVSSYLTYGLNKYTHGAYESAMEIYHGGYGRFMVLGAHDRPRAAAIQFVASKGTEACFAIAGAATAMKRPDLSVQIKEFLDHADPNVS
jgi:hypothetical protein